MTSMTVHREDDFATTVLRHGDRAVVYVSGDVDLSTEDHLRQALLSLIGAQRVRQVVVDLREIGFFGSDGLRVLAQAQLASELEGVTLTLAAVPPNVLRIMEITGMAGSFRIRKLAPT